MPAVGQRRAAERRKVDRHDAVLGGAERLATRAAACKFRRMALSVGEAQRVALEAFRAGDREAGRRIEPAGDQHHRAVHG